MEGLTAVFGMRTGVPPPLKHQHTKFVLNLECFLLTWIVWNDAVNWNLRRRHVLILKNTQINLFGRNDRIRTCDLRFPKTMRYQAALHSDLIAPSGDLFVTIYWRKSFQNIQVLYISSFRFNNNYLLKIVLNKTFINEMKLRLLKEGRKEALSK